jgi:hypothetical protein
MENDETMMIFEVLACSLIKELNELINFNRNKQIVTETTIKRRSIINFLLQIKDKSELHKFILSELDKVVSWIKNDCFYSFFSSSSNFVFKLGRVE